MTQEFKTSPVKFISIIDQSTSNLNLFENLYIPKYHDNTSLEELDIKVFNNSSESNNYNHRNGPSPENIFITPNTALYETKRFQSHERECHLPSLVKAQNTRSFHRQSNWRNSALVNEIVICYNHTKFYDYNLDQHKELINKHNYTPLLLDKSFVKNFLPRNLDSGTRWFVAEAYNAFDEWLENIHLVYWKKVNTKFTPSSGPLKEKLLHSMYSKEIFDAFEGNILNINEAKELYKVTDLYNLSSLVPQRASNRTYWRSSRTNRNDNHNYDVDSPQMCLNTNEYGDLSFLGNSTIQITSSQENEQIVSNESSLKYLIENVFPLKRIKVIKVPSWKSKSNDSEIEFASYTKSQFLKRQTSFAAIICQYPMFDVDLNIDIANYFSLASNASHFDLESKSRVNERILSLFDKLFWHDGMKLHSPDKAQEILNQLFQGLNRYTNKLLESIPQDSLSSLASIKNTFKPFQENHNSSLTMKPKVDSKLELKFKKISLNFKKHSENLEYSYSEYKNLSSSADSLKWKLQQLNELKKTLKEHIDKNCQTISNIYTSAQFIKRNKAIHESISNKYHLEYEKSLKSASYSTDKFFENLSKDEIKILKLTYSFEGTDKHITFDSSSDALIGFIKAQNKESSFYIKEIEFIIDRPVKIKVDNNENRIHVAGPYLVKVNKENIYVKLAYNYSLFGAENSTYCVHPHTGGTNTLLNLLQNWQRGCLGEAATLLYNAFDKKDLKLIVLAAMTWISSANSSDPWGRKYNWFLKPSDINLYPGNVQEPDESQEVIEEDVGDFLQTLFEEDLQEQLPTEVAEETSNTVESPRFQWNPQNFTAPQRNYTPLTGIN
jgi:hypothetical protein